jgi:hypothetical protein
MQNISKIIMTIQTIMFPLCFFKHTKILFKKVSTHLGASCDCVFTLIISYFNSHNYIYFKKERKRMH